ncbi:MAG TPA: TonB-dependent receptor, partial [Thermoanaerobaculia bacterium]
QGDFSTAGSASVNYVNALDRAIAKVDGGTNGYGRALVARSFPLGQGNLLWAVEAAHDNGPWVHPDNMRKYNGVLRYSRQSDETAFSITAMGYRNAWNSTDQVADRAVAEGLVSPFGAVDPTDGGETHRYSLSADWQRNGDDSVTRATAYAVDYGLDLFSNFTYDLLDPVNGDQFEQVDRRVVTGFKASRTWLSSWFGRETQNTVGVQARNDNIAENGLFHTRGRQVLDPVRVDHVLQTSGSLYFESSLRWSAKVRTVFGLRADSYFFHVRGDDPANSGDARQSLVSPKLSLVLGPWEKTELYANAGYGFHSNDARGATITEDPRTHEPVDRVTPLVRAKGIEVGVRTVVVPRLQTTLSLWGLDMGSELVFTGDAGTTEPSRPSRRTGVEVASYWSPLSGLVLDADLALSHARFRDSDPAGNRIPGAVETVASAGVSWENVSRFSGSLRLRYFGPRPLIEDDSVRSRSSTLVNTQIGYEIANGVRVLADIFNVLNARASDVDYFYRSRLPGEPAGGIDDVHSHPAEPRTVRVGVIYSF